MPKHIQRKRFDHPVLASEAVNGFAQFGPISPLVKITVEARAEDNAYWVYVTHEGALVTNDIPLLPGYALVA